MKRAEATAGTLAAGLIAVKKLWLFARGSPVKGPLMEVDAIEMGGGGLKQSYPS